jgi:DNA polymerase III gamma/tau subunit
MSYKQSLIIKNSSNQIDLEFFVEWLNTKNDSSLNSQNIFNQPNISIINQEGESIKIQTIRDMKEKLSFSAYQANQTRYFVLLNAHLATLPAQNALLKSIEEPPQNTQIVLVSKNPQKLLGTIRSRCLTVIQGDQNIKPNENVNEEVAMVYSKIITSSKGAQITVAAKYKEREDALTLCEQLITFFHQELKNKNTKLTTLQITQNCERLLVAVEHLEHNANVLLALENCFFDLK